MAQRWEERVESVVDEESSCLSQVCHIGHARRRRKSKNPNTLSS